MKKGPKGEKEITELLQQWGFPAKRRHDHAKSWDLDGVGHIMNKSIPIEVKYAKRWNLFKWVRAMREVAQQRERTTTYEFDNEWAIFAIHGDRRTQEGAAVGRVMVVDADFGAELLQAWQRMNDSPFPA